MLDTIIAGGKIVDGTGAPARHADIGIKEGRIVEIGKISSTARHIHKADGALVTPGWVDAHTHYDGQITWDDRLEGSASNGVTTVVTGNCGVGFAPVAPGGERALINLMEGVEDIPGTALAEGMPWGEWESFPEYLDLLDKGRWALDVGTQVAHGPLRFYVMGERAVENADASGEELQTMASLLQQAAKAGALGFSTSRVQGHVDTQGRAVPGTFAAESELMAMAQALAGAGGRVFQAIPAGTAGDNPKRPEHAALLDEIDMLGRISRQTAQPVVFSSVQLPMAPDQWRDVLTTADKHNANGARLAPMVAPRPVTFLTSLRTYHMFMLRPTYMKLAGLGHGARLAELRKPEIKAAILAETDVPGQSENPMENSLPSFFADGLSAIYPMYPGFNYEPQREDSLKARARAAGRDPHEFTYDFLLEQEGTVVAAFLASNFALGNLDCCHEMLSHPSTVTGLSDAGAHVRFISDMASATYALSHWTRDRSRGERLPIELVVQKMTQRPAQLFGLHDRGTLEVGARADLNIIDYDNLREHMPFLRADLPAGGSRFLQLSSGYLATYVAGVQTRDRDHDTGERPGRLVRSGR